MKKQKRVAERYECLMPASLLLKSAIDGAESGRAGSGTAL